MSVRIVYGRAGTGKSSFCFEQIQNQIKEHKRVFMITPEQFSFTAEQKLIEGCKQKASIYAEVITFGRMANRVLESLGRGKRTFLTKQGKQMLLYRILSQEKKNLNFLGKSKENVELIERTITELKKHNITLAALDEQIRKEDSVYLKKKLEDISRIYHAYEDRLKEKFYDENDSLNQLVGELEKISWFQDAEIYIDEFSGFTPQEYEIIRVLMKKAHQVTITLCTESVTFVPEENIFHSNYITYQKLMQLASDENVVVDTPLFLERTHRFKTEELSYLEKNLYTYAGGKPYPKQVENIHVLLAANPYTEVQEIAKTINQLVQKKNYRYRDIAIITKTQEQYESLVKVIFDLEKIPVFIDEKKDLSQGVFVKFLLSVLEIFAKSWSKEAVLASLKTGFYRIKGENCEETVEETDARVISKESLSKIENYCNQFGICGKAWYEKDWELKNEKISQEELDYLNQLRKQLVEPLVCFQEKLRWGKTVREITQELYEFLLHMQVQTTLQEKIDYVIKKGRMDIAEEYMASIPIAIRTLDEMVELFGDEEISFEKYYDLLKIGFRVDLLGKIPTSLDQVMLGDVERSRSHKVKAVFILGVNDGVFPSFQKEEGFLNDKERDQLKEDGIELAKGSYENLYEDQFNIYKAFSIAEEGLYVSYVSSDKEGKALRPSVLIHKLKKLFPNLVEQSDVVQKQFSVENEQVTFETLLEIIQKKKNGEEVPGVWAEVYQYYRQNPIWNTRLSAALNAMNGNRSAQRIEEQHIRKLYGKVLKTSVSKLEQYRKCPFSFHLKYGLRLQEKPEFKLRSIDTGSFMHEVIEKFFWYLEEQGKSVKNIAEADIEKIVTQVIEQVLAIPKNYLFYSTPKFRFLTKRLKNTITQSIIYIVYQLQNSSFEVCGTEIEFSDTSAYAPIRLELETGEKIEVTGKIDRIDLAKAENGKYLRIIDYKSSAKSIDLNEVVAGLQIQLLTYMDAASQIEKAIPAGILYFGLMEHVAKKRLSEEDIKKEIRKQFKMNGVLLADVQVVKMMDHSLEKGYSETLPVYIDKDGNLSITRSNVVTDEQFKILQKYTKKIIKELSREILHGNIEIKPYYDGKKKKAVCQYCPYLGICGFNPKEHSYFQIPQLDKQTVLEKLQKEEG